MWGVANTPVNALAAIGMTEGKLTNIELVRQDMTNPRWEQYVKKAYQIKMERENEHS